MKDLDAHVASKSVHLPVGVSVQLAALLTALGVLWARVHALDVEFLSRLLRRLECAEGDVALKRREKRYEM